MNYYPYCGRTFVCSDSVGINDIRQARSAFAFALNYGEQQCNAYSRAWNFRDGAYMTTSVGTTRMFDEPLVGFSIAGFRTQANAYSNVIPLELVDSYDAAAITIGFRFASVGEVAFFTAGQGGTGVGAYGQKITVSINNIANSAFLEVVDIFYDRSWYFANVGPVSGNNWIDLASGTSQGVTVAQQLEQDGHNVITIITNLPRSLRQINRACAASLNLSYQLPRNINGGIWTSTIIAPSLSLQPKPHPLSGAIMAFCGINEAEVRMFRTDAWEQGTAPATANNSRAYPLTPIPSWPAMGDTYTAGVQNSLTAYANSINGIGWVAFNAVGANSGGFFRPVIGFSNQFTEQMQTLTTYGEIPEGATQFMALAYARYNVTGGGTQTHRIRINANGFDTLATQTNNQGAVWWYVTGSLSNFSQPTNGQVNRCDIILELEKTVYATRNMGSLYWDGIQSILLKFF